MHVYALEFGFCINTLLHIKYAAVEQEKYTMNVVHKLPRDTMILLINKLPKTGHLIIIKQPNGKSVINESCFSYFILH